MRIEIVTGAGERFCIDTASGEIAGQWFAEMIARVISCSPAMPEAQLRIWPHSDAELPANCRLSYLMGEDDLRELAEAVIAGADRLKAAAKVRR